MVVREIGLQRDTDLPGAVQVRMALATYFAGEPSALPRTASGKVLKHILRDRALSYRNLVAQGVPMRSV